MSQSDRMNGALDQIETAELEQGESVVPYERNNQLMALLRNLLTRVPEFAKSSYAGTGVAQDIEVGFPCDVIVTLNATAICVGFRGHGAAKGFKIANGGTVSEIAANGFTFGTDAGLNPTKVTVGTEAGINTNGQTYRWFAFGVSTAV